MTMPNRAQVPWIERQLQVVAKGLPLALLVAALVLGFGLADDFGMSWDEPLNVGYGRWALDQYRGPGLLRWTQGAEFTKGPFYFILYSKLGDLIAHGLPSWTAANGRHFVNYLTFLLGVLSFHTIARRLLSGSAALITTLLFATQPLLFGHAFVNQKDIPFMAFFVTTVGLGLWAVDRFVEVSRGPGGETWRDVLGDLRWDMDSQPARTKGLALGGVLALIGFELALFGERLILPWLQSLVRRAHSGTAPAPLNALFRWAAADASSVPVEPYLQELYIRYVQMTWLSLPLCLLALVAVTRWVFPSAFRRVRHLTRPWLGPVTLAATFFGVTIGLREAGPLAGVLVGIYLLAKAGRRAIPVLILYGLVAGVVAYSAWPTLWGNPAGKLLERLVRVSDFPQVHDILYRGRRVLSTNLPWHYIPWLAAIQLTIPTLLCVGIGAVFLGRRFSSRSGERWILLLILTWLVGPVVAILMTGAGVYGNIRHLLFTMPPLFMVAGLAIDEALRRMTRGWQPALTVALLLLPGVIAIYQGHPYQYVYYNELVGGVAGAEGRYELDHWCTSHLEAMAFVNQAAAEGSLVAVHGAVEVASAYARHDLRVEAARQVDEQPEFGVDCGPDLRNDTEFPAMEVVYQVESRGAVLNQVSARR